MYYYTAARREYTASAKVSQFWVNPVLIVNCTFWKNIWEVSVFLFIISTQQSVPKISWFVQVMSDHVTSFSPFSSPIADVSPVRDGASWQPGGSQRADPARRPAGGGGGSAGRRSTAPRPGPDPEESREHTEAEHHSSTPYEKNTDTLKTLTPTVRPETVNKPFSFLCFTFKPAFFWLVTWSKQSKWAAGGASVQLVLVSSC